MDKYENYYQKASFKRGEFICKEFENAFEEFVEVKYEIPKEVQNESVIMEITERKMYPIIIVKGIGLIEMRIENEKEFETKGVFVSHARADYRHV